MKKTLGILVIALSCLAIFQNCQKSDFLVVTGVVRDSLTNQPVEGAYIVTENMISRTASDGTFSIEGVRKGKSTFSIHGFRGYKVYTKSVIITEGQINKLDFTISKIADPLIQTGRIKSILADKALISGSIKLKPNVYASSYGHCWSTNSTPSLENAINKTNFGGTHNENTFTSVLQGLQSGVLYYVRAYAVTDAGTIYGNTLIFKTSDLTIDAGILAYLPFSGNFEDASGNNTVWGWDQFLTSDRFNLSNNALGLGYNSFTYSYSNSGLYNSFNDFSISFWFYKTNWQNNTAMVCTGYPVYKNEIRIGEENTPNKIFFDIITTSGTKYKVSASSAPELNKWHHVVALRNGTIIQLYIDGILQNTESCDDQLINNASTWGYTYLFLGSDLWSTPYYEGKLDDVRIYDRVLTDSEIKTLYSH